MSLEIKYLVSAAPGGYANHVAWIIWLHDFAGNIINPNKTTCNKDFFNVMKGDDWPEFEDLKKRDVEKLNKTIEQELRNFGFLPRYISDKVSFILQEVYSHNRSWHNWLKTEYMFRNCISAEISHEAKVVNNNIKNVFCKINPDIAYRNYLKINSSLNLKGKDFLKKEILEFSYNADKLNSSSCLVVDNDIIFKETLDKTYYEKIRSFFDAEDRYEEACVIHNAWWNAQMKSEKDFLQEVKRLYEQ